MDTRGTTAPYERRLRLGRIGPVLLLLTLAILDGRPDRARAAVDVSGLWRIEFDVGTVTGSCLLTITQTGTTLSSTGQCEFGAITVSGTIDPTSGVFTASTGGIPICSSATISATLNPDGRSFSGTITCVQHGQPNDGTLVGSQCGNGVVQAGEECDDGNFRDGDCCSAACRFEPRGSACAPDVNACTDDVCDGAGQCRHLEGTSPCGDGNGCTAGDRCNGAGSCAPGPAVPCGSFAQPVKSYQGETIRVDRNIDGFAFFVSYQSLGPGARETLWKVDGTDAVPIYPQVSPPYHDPPVPLAVLGNKIMLLTSDREIVVGDGTTAPTVLFPSSPELSRLKVVGDTLFFSVSDLDIWKTDGTPGATARLPGDLDAWRELSPKVQAFAAAGGKLFFGTAIQIDQGPFVPTFYQRQLWSSDGARTTLVKSLFSVDNQGTAPFQMVDVGGTLFFSAGDELWKSDGTSTGTVLLKHFVPPTGSSTSIDRLTAFHGLLFFAAFSDGTEDRELWRSDGTPAGTVRVKDIRPGPESGLSQDSHFVVADDTLFFTAQDDAGVCAHQLWRSDGTEAGTTRVFDVAQTSGLVCMSEPISSDGLVFFLTGIPGVSDRSQNLIWRSDGTATGTVPVHRARGFQALGVNGAILFVTGTAAPIELRALRRCRPGETCINPADVDIGPGPGPGGAGADCATACDDRNPCTIDTCSSAADCRYAQIDVAMARTQVGQSVTLDACAGQRVPARLRSARSKAASLLGRAEHARRAAAKRRLGRAAAVQLEHAKAALGRARKHLTGGCLSALTGELDTERSVLKCARDTL